MLHYTIKYLLITARFFVVKSPCLMFQSAYIQIYPAFIGAIPTMLIDTVRCLYNFPRNHWVMRLKVISVLSISQDYC